MNTPEVYAPDVTTDLRKPIEIPPEADETYIDSQSSQVITSLLIVAIAARPHHSQQTLIRRQDEYLINGEPLQHQAVEILRGAAVAGLYRMRGEHAIQSVEHSTYDQLFDRFPDQNHIDFVNRLAEHTWHKAHLLSEPVTYELRVEERQKFRENEELFTKLGFKLFRDMFLGYATAAETPDKYSDLLERTVDPAVLRAFLDENYLRLQRQFVPLNIDKPSQEREYDFYDWMLEQARDLRSKQLGAKAIASTAK